MKIAQLYIYPVKSCRGISLSATELDNKGFKFDRRFMFVDEHGEMLTQRTHHRMALIDCAIADEQLHISSEGFGEIKVPLEPANGASTKAKVWSDVCKALKVSALADDWISDFLQTKSSLVFMPTTTKRVVDIRYNTTKAITSFTDGFPILIISQASLDDLNARLETPLPMTRFRPNLVVSGFEPYEEDKIQRFEINGIPFEVKKPCARCVITTIDPFTAEKGKEPLQTLAKYRMKKQRIYFGQNVIHLQHEGKIQVGDSIITN